jgi:hypothetical protein
MFAYSFFQHDKINYVHAFTVRFTVGGKAVGGVRVRINLHAWCFVRMEGTAKATVPVCPQAVVLQDGFNAQPGFDFYNFHALNGFDG